MIYSSEGKAEFSVSMSLESRFPSEIILKYADSLLKKHFLSLSMLKTVVLCNTIVETDF